MGRIIDIGRLVWIVDGSGFFVWSIFRVFEFIVIERLCYYWDGNW